MKTYFASHKCENCGQAHDPTLSSCPKCGGENESLRGNHAFDHHVHETFPLQITFILIQTLGMILFGVLLAIGVEIGYIMSHPNATAEELTAYVSSVSVSFGLNAAGYVAVLIVYLLIEGLRKRYKELFKSFANWKSYVFGAIGGGLIILITYLYSLSLSGIFQAAGFEPPGPNHNEILVQEMVRAFPVLSFFIFGFIGPFGEEMGYRVGLFGFCSRLGKFAAYAISGVVFGLAHFDIEALTAGDSARLIVEFANLPSYVGAGLLLGFIYDRFGLAASYTAHTLNNVVSLITTLAGPQA